ncbi:hypothetical protein BK146_06515 [Paenibacillus sp. FSL R7-0333]|nr:hypothetical protein BK146_06515 [Paenibacillus sp. FSL R7-0333]
MSPFQAGVVVLMRFMGVWLGVTDLHLGIVVECTLKNSEKAYVHRISVVCTTKSARIGEFQKQIDF